MIIAPRHHAGVLVPLIWVSIVAYQHLCDTFLLRILLDENVPVADFGIMLLAIPQQRSSA
jgi:hypothetical protein